MTIQTYIIAGAVAAALIVGLTCKYILKEPANPVEKAAETIIEKETGIDFDFSATATNLIDNRNAALKKLEEKVEQSATKTGGDIIY